MNAVLYPHTGRFAFGGVLDFGGSFARKPVRSSDVSHELAFVASRGRIRQQHSNAIRTLSRAYRHHPAHAAPDR